MTLSLKSSLAFLCALCLLVFAAGCDSDDVRDTSRFTVSVQNVDVPQPVLKSGAVASPGAGNLGPDSPALFPGESVSFSFTAPPSTLPPLGGSGMRFNFATMFAQSNDLFYAFPPAGLDLYDDEGAPVTAT